MAPLSVLSSLLDRERDKRLFGRQRNDERLRRVAESGVVEQPSEVEHVFGVDGDAGELHGSKGTGLVGDH